MTLKKTYKNITLIIPKKERCNTYMSKENYKEKDDKKQYHHFLSFRIFNFFIVIFKKIALQKY